jgi:hypothetical protein
MEVRATSAGRVDVGEVTTRCLLYGLLPSWFVPELADWMMHRRTRIEDTAGTRESVIHALMMAEVGIPIAATPRYEVDPALLAVQPGGAAVHEATALWDVRTAVDSGREVRPIEQHIHSFPESLPFGAPASPMCLHADQVKSLLRRGRGAGRCPVPVRRASRPRSAPVCCCRRARSCCAVGGRPDGTRNARRATRPSGVPRKDVEDSCVSHS